MAEPSQVDPALVTAVVDAAMRLVGMSGGGGLLALAIGYFGKRWFDERRRLSGDDPEHTAKTETREQIKAQGAALAAVSESLAVTAKIQERMLRELEEMRRESREAHADIKAELRRA